MLGKSQTHVGHDRVSQQGKEGDREKFVLPLKRLPLARLPVSSERETEGTSEGLVTNRIRIYTSYYQKKKRNPCIVLPNAHFSRRFLILMSRGRVGKN